ncbi:BTAD domain-containing putative transcriptional regulator [Micromonospora sp. WMMC241]|uniref:ATP-binding protein n=1 Tax=Micromonospora sp. WMMC241 TaxID=3015159 RepID=UPI0022B6269C|nr:BTAD domain-containing putative transcriptional regulator [Micromonospora sp. WMMC241]MCZ7439687.1 BTAD domain-containing putative transcriptional regulator [Micromonospora sp. WMMC241]
MTAATGAPSYRILGPLEVTVGGTAVPIPAARHRAVLAMLLLSPNRDVARETLVDRLWNGTPPDGAVKTLQSYVSRLRTLLRADPGVAVVAGHDGRAYRIEVAADAVDAALFRRLVDEGRAAARGSDDAGALDAFDAALGLWRDRPLVDLADEYRFVDGAVRAFEGLRVVAVEGALRAAAGLGRLAERVADVESAVERYPDRAVLRRLHLRALYETGRQADALAAYERYRRLRRDYGLDPEPEVEEVYLRVLRQDPGLRGRPVEAPGFVGRGAQLGRLRAALAAAVAGRGRCVLVEGEAGIGKTALGTRLMDLAAADGVTIATGTPHDVDGHPAYRPWLQVLDAIPGGAPARTQLAVAGGSSAREGQFAAVTDALRSAAARTPLVVVLDDLHEADAASVTLAQHVVRLLPGVRVLLLVLARDAAGADPTTGWAEAAARLRRLPGVETLRLGPLDGAAVTALVGHELGRSPDPALLAAVTDRAGGNPLFAVELTRLLAGEQARGRVAGGRPGVPPLVRDVVRQRATALPQPCRDLLAFAATLGFEFEGHLLTTGGTLSADQVAAALRTAVDHDFVEETPGRAGRYRFRHPLVHEALYDDVPSHRRERLHRRAAEVLERAHAAHLDRHAERLSHHWRRAGTADRHRAYDWTLRAARQAAGALAWEEAARLLAVALDLRTPDGDRDDGARLRIELGVLQFKAGLAGAAGRTFLAAVAEADRPEVYVRAVLALADAAIYLTGLLTPDTAAEMLSRALASLGPHDTASRSRVLAHLAAVLVWHTDGHTPANRERRDRYSREAVDLAHACGDRTAVRYALRARIDATWRPENPRERLDMAAELVSSAIHDGDRDLALEGERARFVAALELGRADLARAAADACAAAADELQIADRLFWACVQRSTLALMAGRFAAAEEAIVRAFELGAGLENRTLAHVHTGVTAQVLLLHREIGRAPATPALDLAVVERSMVELTDRLSQLSAIWRLGMATFLLNSDRREQAHELYAEVLAGGLLDTPLGAQWLGTMALAADLSAEFGDVRTATEVNALLQPFAEQFVVVTFGFGNLGSVEHFLGRLATVLGDDKDAEERFHAAVTANRRLGAAPLVARSQVELGRLLSRTDADRGRTQLALGAAAADRLGMAPLARSARSAGRASG